MIAKAVLSAALACFAGAAVAPAQEPRLGTHVVRSEAMAPSFSLNERVEFDGAAYDEAPPQVGDVVLFHPPRGAFTDRCGRPRGPGIGSRRLCARPHGRSVRARTFISRVVAVPGDRIRFGNGRAVVDGVVEGRRINDCEGYAGKGCTYRRAITVPRGHVYLAGDNRPAAHDSRFYGAIKRAWIVGRVTRSLGPAGT